MAATQKLETVGHSLLFALKTRRASSDWDRDNKGRRQSMEYTDTSGTKVDLNGLLAKSFRIDRDPAQETFMIKGSSAVPKDKMDRKLIPKLSSLKRRRRSTALYLLAEADTANEMAS